MAQFQSRFTPEANEYLKQNGWNYTSRELSKKMLEMFGVKVAKQTVTDQLRRLGINRGPCYRPPGYVESCCKPVGSERIDKNRTVMVKVAQPNEWKPKALVVMNYNPRTHQVIYLDGNSLNVEPENMVVVSKRVHARLAKNGWLNKSREITLTGIKWSELLYVLKEMEERP